MGAWGMGVFDDDTSCEIMEDAIDEGTSINALICKALAASDSEYIEYTECHDIIVAGAMMNALLNGVVYEGVEDLDPWLVNQNKDQAALHTANLVLALKKVLSEGSELNELWSENEDDYPTWRGNIEAIISDLDS
ncbi:MAG: hypothetical protein CMI09_13495 [Oceanospirillaceae bacterium]|nr:hypothetical protein [Oceanospirillaceae bacterium]|tara:strand:+ start:1055 stop:1459 length:405 start_codon:yes stop_codon:yes gene_type:complete